MFNISPQFMIRNEFSAVLDRDLLRHQVQPPTKETRIHMVAHDRISRQTVHIVDDDELIRDSIGNLLKSRSISSSCFASAEDFLDSLKPTSAGCVLLDVRLSQMSGMDLWENAESLDVNLPIIMMSGYADIPMVRRSLLGGVVDFLTKPFQEYQLLAAVRNSFALDLARKAARDEQTLMRSRYGSLSIREREILSLITEGHTNLEIASDLCIVEGTVKFHRGNIMKKMQANSFAELIKMSLQIQELQLISATK